MKELSREQILSSFVLFGLSVDRGMPAPTSGRAVSFTQSTDIKADLFQKYSSRHTQK